MRLSGLWFFALAVLLSSQLGRHFWGDWSFVWGLRIDYLSWTLYLTDILVVVMLVWWWRETGGKGQGREGKKLPIWGWLTVLVAAVNVGWALRPEVAIYQVYSFLVVAGLAVYVARNSVERWLGWGLAIGLTLNLVLAVLQVIGGRSVGGGWWWLGERTFSLASVGIAKWEFLGRWWLRPYGTFSHPNALGGFALVSAAILSGLKFDERVKRWGVMAAVGLGVLSLSQAVWAGFLLLVVGRWWLCLRRWGSMRARRWILVVGFWGLTMAGTVAVFAIDLPGSFWTRRQMLARAAAEIFKGRPAMGVGLGNFVVALAPVLPKTEAVYFLQPVHNGWLLLVSELGIVGMGVIFLGLGKLVVQSVKYGRGEWLVALVLIWWLLTWDHYVLTLQQNQLLLGVVVGLLAKGREYRA